MNLAKAIEIAASAHSMNRKIRVEALYSPPNKGNDVAQHRGREDSWRPS